MIDKNLKIYDSVCTGCSACIEACQFSDEHVKKPIKLILNEHRLLVPRINSSTCKTCMACYKACQIEDKIYTNEISFEVYKAKIGECYFGYSLDNEHRFEAATAGIATEIATFLLETNQVDGVVSSYQNGNNKIVTKIFTDSKDVKKTRGSIYRQIPLLKGLVENIKKGNYKKLLVIGLPCHIAGLYTLHKANKYLRENIGFITIALFCKQTKMEEFSDFERRLLQVKPNQRIYYRGKGWPGFTRVDGGRSLLFTNVKFSLNWSSFAFAPSYCFTCSDPLGIIADISIGDAWLKKYYGDKIGSSLFVANTEIGKRIINEMVNLNKIYIEKESVENIIGSQNTKYIKFKTSYINERRVAFGGLAPHNEYVSQGYKRLIKWIKFNKWLYETMVRSKIVHLIPELLLKVYGRVSRIVFNKMSNY